MTLVEDVRRSAGRVLIVDDDELISVTLFEHLASLGLDISRAVTPQEAFGAMHERAYDVVVVDAYLTGQLHGRPLELIQQVRASQPGARIVVVTAYGSDEFLASLRASGPILALQKPQPVAHLAAVIGEALALQVGASEGHGLPS